MKILKNIVFFVTAITICSCMKTIIWDEGAETTRSVRTVDYDTIEFRGIFDVLLVPDTTNYVNILCGINLIDKVRTFQKRKYIEISETPEMNLTRSYKRTFVEMHFTQISHIFIHEGVHMKSSAPVVSPFLSIWDDSNLSEIDMEIICSGFALSVSPENFGIYKISGTSGYTFLEPDGSAHYQMENLAADSCHVNHKGIGDCYVNVKNVLEGQITGKGRLLYKNNPSLRVNIDNHNGKCIPQSD
jgi:hypothetical protein